MAFSMRVLADVRGAFASKDISLKDAAKDAEEFKNLVYAYVYDKFEERYRNDVDYFDTPPSADEPDLDTGIFGIFEPEELRAEVSTWNNTYKEALRDAVKDFDAMVEKIKADHPETVTASGLVSVLEHIIDDYREYFVYWNTGAIYRFANALRDIATMPAMFCSHAMTMFPSSDEYFDCMEFGIVLSREKLAEIIAHPERYAVVDVIYH